MLPILKRRRGRRGFALIDYLCGSIIMVAVLISVTSLNVMKSKTLRFARQRHMAIFCAKNLLIEEKSKLLSEANANVQAARKADAAKKSQWTDLTVIKDDPGLKNVMHGAIAKVQVRPATGAAKQQFFEMRVLVEWRWDVDKTTSSQLSTLVKRGAP